MIRSIFVIGIALSAFVFAGANQKDLSLTEGRKRNCMGYTVVEVDKGIDCNGDTIRLVKVNGFFERVR